MEFDSNICRLQSELNSLEKRNLLNVTDSSEAINRLKDIFRDVDQNARARMSFFMLLNTEIKVLDLLKNDANVGLFVDVSSRLSKKFLIHLIYNLELQKEFYDIIISCPCEISVDLLDALVVEVKLPTFHHENFGTSVLYDIEKTIFSKLFMTLNQSQHRTFLYDYKIYFDDILKLIVSVIKTAVKIESPEVIQFAATQFLNFFDLFYFCLKIENDSTFSRNDLYNIEIVFETDDSGHYVPVTIKQCQDTILKYCQEILELITLNMWLDWSECEGNNSNQSAQNAIGEKIFFLCDFIETCQIEVPDLTKSCLNHFKIKPETEEEKISKASIDEIVKNVHETQNRKWFKALIYFEKVQEDENLIDCLISNLNLADEEDIQFLLQKSLKCLKNGGTPINDKTKTLFLSIISKLSAENQLQQLDCLFQSGDYKLLETPYCNAELTEIFNKLCGDKEQELLHNELLMLCIQAPVNTLLKICFQAVQREVEIKKWSSILFKFKTVCLIKDFDVNFECIKDEALISYILSRMLDNDVLTMKEKQALIKLITCLGSLLGFKFLEKYVLDDILRQSKVEKWCEVAFRLDILRTSIKVKAFEYDNHILLAFLSQFLGHLSWDWGSFIAQKADLREATIAIISLLMKRIDKDDPEVEWLRSEVSKQWEFNQPYFCDLWYQFHKKFLANQLSTQILVILNTKYNLQTMLEVVTSTFSKLKVQDIKSHIVSVLVQLLPILTSKEWIALFAHLKTILLSVPQSTSSTSDVSLIVLNFFTTSLYILCHDMNINQDSFSCFEFCLRNLGRLIQQTIFLKKSLTSESFINVYKKLAFILSEIKSADQRRYCCLIISAVMLELIEIASKNEMEEVTIDYNEIKTLTRLLKVDEFEKALNNKIRDFLSENLDS